jgi:hypothetical protein
MKGERVYSGQHIDLFILLIQQVLQFPDFGFQPSNAIFQRLCVASREGSSAQLVTRLTLEANVGALGATWSDAIASWAELVSHIERLPRWHRRHEQHSGSRT